jgi:transposase
VEVLIITSGGVRGEVSTIEVDLAKSVFQVHGADASGAVLFRKKLRRHQVLTFFAAQPRCTVAMEACGSAHHWAREIGRLGHGVRLIPPAYVKPFVKRQKNDAEAICEAAQRPTMRSVVPKSEQAQEADARIAGGPLHDHTSRLQKATSLRILDDEQGCAVLHGLARVHELGLAQDGAPSPFGGALQPDHWRVANRVHDSMLY